jgi:hypothetical protein
VQFTTHDLKGLLDACAGGNAEARMTFQEAYGSLIYTFPRRIYHLSEDEAGDFYLYVFVWPGSHFQTSADVRRP